MIEDDNSNKAVARNIRLLHFLSLAGRNIVEVKVTSR